MTDDFENAIEFLNGQKTATVTLYRGRLQNRILRLAEERPDEVAVICRPEENNGFLFAHIPLKWLRIQPPKQMSEEQREKAKERLARVRGDAE